MNTQIENSWFCELGGEFEEPYFAKLKSFLANERKQYSVYPPESLIFNAFERTPFRKVKVVILGQDPYHGRGQAHGLSFSVPNGVKPPPSLRNIFKEIKSDLEGDVAPRIEPSTSGNLEQWTDQGVFLLNAILTVRGGKAGSHQNKGWEIFTDNVIKKLSDRHENLVFMLWGNYARTKNFLIDKQKHLILEAAHPSNFPAKKGFFGCKHFSQANEHLRQHGLEQIGWSDRE